MRLHDVGRIIPIGWPAIFDDAEYQFIEIMYGGTQWRGTLSEIQPWPGRPNRWIGRWIGRDGDRFTIFLPEYDEKFPPTRTGSCRLDWYINEDHVISEEL